MSAMQLLATDHQRSILLGTGFARRAFCPYGQLYRGSGPQLAFTGQARDLHTGRYGLGNGHRTYSPTLRRFCTPDRLSPFDKGGINAYAYCLGDPVNREDPQGTFSVISVFRGAAWLSNRLPNGLGGGASRVKQAREVGAWMVGIGLGLDKAGVPVGQKIATVGEVIVVAASIVDGVQTAVANAATYRAAVQAAVANAGTYRAAVQTALERARDYWSAAPRERVITLSARLEGIRIDTV